VDMAVDAITPTYKRRSISYCGEYLQRKLRFCRNGGDYGGDGEGEGKKQFQEHQTGFAQWQREPGPGSRRKYRMADMKQSLKLAGFPSKKTLWELWAQ
jgi:hypothetical protein